MDIFQTGTLILLAVFYSAYLIKAHMQKSQGITTNQMGKGDKSKRTLRVEKLLGAATFTIVPVELASIIWNRSGFAAAMISYIGMALAVAGVLLFIIAMVTMRDSWRAGIPSDDRTHIVKSGIYRFSRNPAFLGFDLMYIGIFITFPNIIHLVSVLFAVIMLHMQILEEEKFLSGVFGNEYLEFKKQVGRYFII